eukprot:1195217-Prorocentrum_minimum.AAC.3
MDLDYLFEIATKNNAMHAAPTFASTTILAAHSSPSAWSMLGKMRFRTGAFRTKSTVDTAPVSQSASQSASQSLSHSSRLPANVQSNLFFWVGGWCCDSFSRRVYSLQAR